jgi:hypothetical protein
MLSKGEAPLLLCPPLALLLSSLAVDTSMGPAVLKASLRGLANLPGLLLPLLAAAGDLAAVLGLGWDLGLTEDLRGLLLGLCLKGLTAGLVSVLQAPAGWKQMVSSCC